MDRRQLLADITRELREHQVAEPGVIAKHLISSILDCSLSDLYVYGRERVGQRDIERLEECVGQLIQGVPLAYVLGERYFMGLRFTITPDVLIPRQDTELVCETALEWIKRKGYQSGLDLCCGSGAIGVSLDVYGPESLQSIQGVDISQKAVELANQNGKANGAKRFWVYQSDLFERIENKFDFIVSNPPYIGEAEYQTLDPLVRENEPRLALVAERDGYEFYEKIINRAGDYLHKGGLLLFEIGYQQKDRVMELMRQQGYADICCKQDYAGNDRVVMGFL